MHVINVEKQVLNPKEKICRCEFVSSVLLTVCCADCFSKSIQFELSNFCFEVSKSSALL